MTEFAQSYFLALLQMSWLLFWRISQVCGWELIFLFSSSKEGRAPFWIWEEGEKCNFFNGQVLLWNSWMWEDTQSCAMGISWKGETLRNCFFCFYNSILWEISSFKAVMLLKIRMRLLPVTVGDALDRNVFRGRTGASQKKAVIVLTARLIQGARLKHTFPPWVAFFQRHLNNLEAQALLTSSLVQTCCGAGFASFSSDCLR